MIRVGLVGDVANSFALLNVVIVMALVLANFYGYFDNASKSFLRDGFCVSWPGTLYDSHHLAFYIDTVCAIILAYLSIKHAGMAGDEPVKFAAAGVFFHGLAHLSITINNVPNEIASSTQKDSIARSVGLILFYFFLLRSASNVSNMSACIHACIHGPIAIYLVPLRLNFTYVQTSLLSIATFHSLFKKDKDVFYDLSSLIIIVPVGLMSWLEGFICDSFYIKFGGHVYYDAIIPVSMFLYYAVTLRYYQPKEKSTE